MAIDYINRLNDDSLLQIFKYLSFSEKIHNEVVCKRWTDLLRCTFNTTTLLNVAEFMKTTYRTHYQQGITINWHHYFPIRFDNNVFFGPTVNGLITRVGPWLREISFGARWFKISQEIIDTISEQCVRLTRFDLGCTILNASIGAAVEKLAPNQFIRPLNEHISFLGSNLGLAHGKELLTSEGDVSPIVSHLRICVKKERQKKAPILDFLRAMDTLVDYVHLTGTCHTKPSTEFVDCRSGSFPLSSKKTYIECTVYSQSNIPAAQRWSFSVPVIESSSLWHKTNAKLIVFISSEDSQHLHLLFPQMTSLRCLNLRHAPFPLTCLPHLPACLQSVNLNGARGLTQSVLHQFLLGHPNLIELRLSSQQRIDQTCVEILSNLTQLQILELSYNQIELDLVPLVELYNLEELYLQFTVSVEDICFHAICSQLPKLRHINVTGCKRIRDYSCLSECKSLQKILAGHTVQICDEDLTVLSKSDTLRGVSLIHCHNVTTLGVLELSHHTPNLAEVSVQYCSEVGDAALIALVSRQQRPIPVISLQGCQLSTEGVSAIAQLDSLAELVELDISYNRSVGEEAVFAIREALARFYKYEAPPHRPTIYTHLTAVSKPTTTLVQDYVNLIF